MTQQGNNGQEFTNSSSCMYTPHTCRGLCTVHDGVSKSCVTDIVQTPYHPPPGFCLSVVINIPLCCCSSICILVRKEKRIQFKTEPLQVSGLLKNRPHIIHCEGGGCKERWHHKWSILMRQCTSCVCTQWVIHYDRDSAVGRKGWATSSTHLVCGAHSGCGHTRIHVSHKIILVSWQLLVEFHTCTYMYYCMHNSQKLFREHIPHTLPDLYSLCTCIHEYGHVHSESLWVWAYSFVAFLHIYMVLWRREIGGRTWLVWGIIRFAKAGREL